MSTTPQSVRPTAFGPIVGNTGSTCASALTSGGGAHRRRLAGTAQEAAKNIWRQTAVAANFGSIRTLVSADIRVRNFTSLKIQIPGESR